MRYLRQCQFGKGLKFTYCGDRWRHREQEKGSFFSGVGQFINCPYRNLTILHVLDVL